VADFEELDSMKAIDRVMTAYIKTRPSLTKEETKLVRRELSEFIEEFMNGRFAEGLKKQARALPNSRVGLRLNLSRLAGAIDRQPI
jgi:hypothetical protein